MKQFSFCLCLIVLVNYCLAQKPVIDADAIRRWPVMADYVTAISPDGRYFSYVIRNQPAGSRTLVVAAIDGSWERESIGAERCIFSSDNKEAIFQAADTLYFLSLDGEQPVAVQPVAAYKYPREGRGEWLAYQLKGAAKELVLKNLVTGKEQRFAGVMDYAFDNRGNTLLVRAASVRDSVQQAALQWVNLREGRAVSIWTEENGEIAGGYDFDGDGRQLTFVVSGKRPGPRAASIWYYRWGMERAVLKADDRTPGIERPLSVSNSAPQFSGNGQWIFFQLVEPVDTAKPKPDAVKVDVWSYKDRDLQPEQMVQLGKGPMTYAVAIPTEGRQVVRLEQESEGLQIGPRKVPGDRVVIADHASRHGFAEGWQDSSLKPSYYVQSLEDGSRKLLGRAGDGLFDFSFSPRGRWLAYFDVKKGMYCCYDIAGDKVRDIARTIPGGGANEYHHGLTRYAVAPVAGWQEDDSALLIYDNYDIWKVDPSGARLPVNITHGYGSAHRLKFRLVSGQAGGSGDPILFRGQESLLIGAFSPVTKYNGFYRTKLSGKGDPELLTMGPYTFYMLGSQTPHFYSFYNGMEPLKAGDADVWILRRCSATEAPNYFVTRDLRTFRPLTHLQPQAGYNWLKAELVSWKLPDGSLSQGVLYKPEDFDPQKKYPVIFNYYEQLSHRMYQFPHPEFAEDDIDVPWFVSRGYLVFTPDIHYDAAYAGRLTSGECARNAVVSAARWLAKRPYIDSRRMAIQGHSFGGFETAYLATHTRLFAAVAESAGITDPVSSYLTLVPLTSSIEHASNQDVLETGHSLFGATPWQRPDIYRRNSAVLSADKTTAPLLIMHNRQDNSIPWRQGVELYMALRRLGKKVWMLQYDEGDHGVSGRDAVDYTIRLTQFFDYYLKGARPPKWMTEGVPAKLKGIDTGYELDDSGKLP